MNFVFVVSRQFTNDSHKAQKYLLGAFEQLCKTYPEKLMTKVPMLLKKMYDLDLLEEEVLISWSKKVNANCLLLSHPDMLVEKSNSCRCLFYYRSNRKCQEWDEEQLMMVQF